MIYDCFVLLRKFRRNEMLPIIRTVANSARFHNKINIYSEYSIEKKMQIEMAWKDFTAFQDYEFLRFNMQINYLPSLPFPAANVTAAARAAVKDVFGPLNFETVSIYRLAAWKMHSKRKWIKKAKIWSVRWAFPYERCVKSNDPALACVVHGGSLSQENIMCEHILIPAVGKT